MEIKTGSILINAGASRLGTVNVDVKQFFSITAQGERQSTSRRIKSSCSNGKMLSRAKIRASTPDVRDIILTCARAKMERVAENEMCSALRVKGIHH